MAERFKIPRPCEKCGKPFLGRDRPNKPARFCSKRCHFLSKATKEWQIKAGKRAGQLNIIRLRGKGKKKWYIKEYGRHQHRIVMEKKLGRKLTSNELVHHIDHNKHNNNPENLQLVTRAEHAKIHLHNAIIPASN
jgi:hypothetical protein